MISQCNNNRIKHNIGSSTYVTYRMSHEVQVWKRGSEIGAINVGLPRTLWKKESMTTGTEYIYSVVPWQIR
jgi:hypothetical protein